MRSDAARGKVVGVLFIVATVAAVTGGTLLLPTQEGRFLADAASSEARVVLGAVFGYDLGVTQAISSAPIGLNEMVLAMWLT